MLERTLLLILKLILYSQVLEFGILGKNEIYPKIFFIYIY